jgi:hypothetical protein
VTDGKPFESIVPDDAVPSSAAGISKIDTSVAHPARIYDYWLGGKDNISQEVSGLPYSGRTVPIQARHDCYSKTALLTRT